MAITLQDIGKDYYDLQGDDPPATLEDRDIRFINRTIEEITSRHKFGFAKVTQTISLTSQVATLTSIFGQIYDVRKLNTSGQQDDTKFGIIEEAQKDDYTSADPTIYITGSYDTCFNLRTNTTDTELQITFYRRPVPLAVNADTTFIPFSRPIAVGAYAKLRAADNPDIDTTNENFAYEQAFRDLVSYDQKSFNRPIRYRGIQELGGYRTGE